MQTFQSMIYRLSKSLKTKKSDSFSSFSHVIIPDIEFRHLEYVIGLASVVAGLASVYPLQSNIYVSYNLFLYRIAF